MSAALIKKLRLLPGTSGLILNPPEWYIEMLKADLPDDIQITSEVDGKYGFVQLFINDSAEFVGLSASALNAIEYDGVFWLSYPKKSAKVESDLSREVVWEMMSNSGLRPVTQISIDKVWSALRFRPVEQVGK